MTLLVQITDTLYFHVSGGTFLYVIEDLPIRVLALNSRSDGAELLEFDEKRLASPFQGWK